MLPRYKVLISFLPLFSLFLQFSYSTQNEELQKDPISFFHFNDPIQIVDSLNSSDLHLNTLFIDEENKSFEEEEQRSARNRIGSTPTKKYRRIQVHSSIALCVYNKSDTSDISPHQLHLRL